jgi:ABC-2 type transport system permease protein
MLKKVQIGVNPIIVKELRSRMRDSRAFITLTAVLLLLGGANYLLYRIILAATQYTYSSTPISPQIGQAMFIALAFLELMMVSAIAPAVTAGAISGEKEKLTYEMLLATPLRPASILWGKLVSALSYVFLLIFAAIPMASLIFIFGGVTLRDMFKALIILVAIAITLGMIGMFMSTWLGRTARATVVSYAFVAALYILPIIAYVAVGVLRQAEPPRWILIASPLSALLSGISPTTGAGDWNFMYVLGMGLGGNLRVLTGAGWDMNMIPRPLYHYSLPLYGLLTMVLYFLSTHLVMPTRRWKLRKQDIAVGVSVLLVFFFVIGAAFWSSSNRYENFSIFAAPTPFIEVWEDQAARPAMQVVEVVPGPYPGPDSTPTPNSVPPRPYPGPSEAVTGWTGSEGLSLETEASLYNAVIRQLYWVDQIEEEFGNRYVFPLLYLGVDTDDQTASKISDLYSSPSKRIDLTVRNLVEEAITVDDALPAKVAWVTSIDTSQFTSDSAVWTDGAAILFGNYVILGDENVILFPAAFYSSEGVRRVVYSCEPAAEGWILTLAYEDRE